MKQKATPRKLKTHDMTHQALELRKAGLTYEKIAEALGIAKSYAHEIIMKGLESIKEDIKTDATTLVALEVERLDALLRSLWANKDNPRHADTILKIMERKAKLQGLDAPTRIEQSGVGGNPIQLQAVPMIDWSKATEEEIRIAKELEKRLLSNNEPV